ncbi:hypothetical protein [Amycolatopsis thermoflava]|uniref:hypothetical protein n=1 Tax=Amycolatopsis thermoflava TaxID=84480 RepID=UPI00365726CE
MRSADIAAALVAGLQSQTAGNTDVGYHLGLVRDWDEATGLNVVEISGNQFSNLRVITAGTAVSISEGDTVVVLRYQTSYFILGKVAAPGAGAALRARQAVVETFQQTTSTTWTDLATVGPVVENVYIGPSRTCMVVVSAGLYNNNGFAYMGFAVSGASTIAPAGYRSAFWANTANLPINTTGTQVAILTAADGLSSGFNTFTAKYRAQGPASAGFDGRVITVIPM